MRGDGRLYAAFRAEDAILRAEAKQRAAVAHDVRVAIYAAQTTALLDLRDSGAINDRVHQDLQLDLDKMNAGEVV